MSLRAAILNNVREEIREEIAYALDLIGVEDFYGLALTFRDYASDMASGYLHRPDGQTYTQIGSEDLARVEAAIARATDDMAVRG